MFEGPLAKIPLGTVLQHIIDQSLTGRLRIRQDNKELLLYFVQGQLLNAQKDPDPEIHSIFNLVQGDFAFDESQDITFTGQPEISTFRWVMDRAVETADPRAMQWVLLSPFAIPQVESIPIVELTDDEMGVTALINDDRTISEIVKASSLPEKLTLQILFGLVVAATIRLLRTYEVVRILVGVLDDLVLTLGKSRLTVNGTERMFGKTLSDALVDHPELEYLELGGNERALNQFRRQFKRAADAVKVLGGLLETFYHSVAVFIESKDLAPMLHSIAENAFLKHRNLVNELRLEELINHIIEETPEKQLGAMWAALDASDSGRYTGLR